MNMHACAVLLHGRGVLIAGASGSGKTRLALQLLRDTTLSGFPAALVADDQVLLEQREERLIGRAPKAIRDQVELRGFGVAALPAVESCALDLLVRLVPANEALRMADGEQATLAGVSLPLLRLPERDAVGAAFAVHGFLFGTPWL